MRKTKHTLAAAAAALLLLASCRGENIPDKQREEAPRTEQSAASGEHSGEIVLAPDKAKAAGVRTEKVTAGAFCGVLTTGGKIMEAPGQEVTLVAGTAGTVSFARPLAEGTKIAAGSTVFTISGRHMQDGDPAERARIAYRTAREDYERAARLAEDKIVSAKELMVGYEEEGTYYWTTRDGLVTDLVDYYEFTQEEAEAGVDAADIDWVNQASRYTMSYIDFDGRVDGYSYAVILDLVMAYFDQKTAEEGIARCNIDWVSEAKAAIQVLIDEGSPWLDTRDKLLQYLVDVRLFTTEEANTAIDGLGLTFDSE